MVTPGVSGEQKASRAWRVPALVVLWTAIGLGALLLLAGGLALGGWHHYQANLAVAATAHDERTYVADVRVATVRAGDSKITVTLPATTTAFAPVKPPFTRSCA